MRSIALALSLLAAACAGEASTPPTAAPAAAASPVVAEAGADDVVATIGGVPVTLAEVDAKAGAALVQARQQMYEARKAALDELVFDRLVEAEARKRGMTAEALIKAEVDDRIPPVDEAEVGKLFDENKARMPPTATLDEFRPRIEQFLSQKGRNERQTAFQEELKSSAEVKVTLDPPRATVTVPQGAPRFGPVTAPVQIVEFSDFECPYCSRAADTVDELKKKYGDKISVVYRHFPLEFHANAKKAAEAAACAGDQGRFWEFHDKMFDNQRALGVDQLKAYAGELGLNGGEFASCLDSGKHSGLVDADMEAGKALGVQGTPGFFVNGRFLGGAMPVDAFSEIIDDELSRRM